MTSILHPDLVCDESTLANKINKAFVNVIEDYSPLTDCVRVDMDDDQPISVNEHSVGLKLREISCARAGGPDDLPNWVLREHADILAAPIAENLNTYFLVKGNYGIRVAHNRRSLLLTNIISEH